MINSGWLRSLKCCSHFDRIAHCSVIPLIQILAGDLKCVEERLRALARYENNVEIHLLILVPFALGLSVYASSPEYADRKMHSIEHASQDELAQLKARGFHHLAVTIECWNVSMEAKPRSSTDLALAIFS